MRPRNSAFTSIAVAFALLSGASAGAQVSSAPLAQVDAWGVGWIGANEGAVPSTFWNNTSAATLGPVMAAIQPRELAPSARNMLARILMSRAKGPTDGADLTVERLRLLEQLGESAQAVDLRKRYPKTDWGKPGERLGAELALVQGDTDAACGSAKTQPAADVDWMPLRAVCAALNGDANAGLIVEQLAKTDESLGVWLIGALPAIGSPDIKKPDGRFGSPVEAAVSVAAKLSATPASFAATPSDIAKAIATNPKATTEQRRAALRAAFNGGKMKAADMADILGLKDDVPAKAPARGVTPRPDYLAQAIAAAADKTAKPDAKAGAYVAALRSAETPVDGRLVATALSAGITALPHNDATLPYAEPLARAALLAGDTKLAAEWRKHLGTLAKDKQDAWAIARLDLMLLYAGATAEKPDAILERLLAAAPYPAPPAAGASTAGKTPAAAADQQLTVRRIENTRVLFLYAGTARDLTPDQRATLAAQRTAGRGVSDAAIARIYAAARQNADAEAALAIVGQLGSDVSALSFAGLADLLVEIQTVGLTEDANVVALEALQAWKAF